MEHFTQKTVQIAQKYIFNLDYATGYIQKASNGYLRCVLYLNIAIYEKLFFMKKVLLLIDYSTEFSRKLLKGLIDYTKVNGEWTFYRMPLYYKKLLGEIGIYNWAKKWNANAIIAQWDQGRFNIFKDLNIPVFLQNYKEKNDYFSYITGDYIGTGKLAARFFIQKGYKNFAFYGYKGFKWSVERAEGYQREIEKIGGSYYYFESDDLNGIQWSKSHAELEEWLHYIPKPIALFACDDNFAIQISEICKMSKISIPQEISLLGVDNDELICNLSEPTISSIVLNIEKGGYEIGRRIDQLILNSNNEPFNISIDPLHLNLRNSTETYSISNKYIKEVVNYMENNFRDDYNIKLLTDLVPLSRRNLEIKFKEEIGTSVYQFILDCRIEHFAKLLISTDREVCEIAIEAGFNTCKNASRLFKKVKGCTPLEFRKKNTVSQSV